MSMYGSSPRVRGKPDQRRDPVRRERIIPARAGQTRWCREYRIPKPDHPRACGANLSTSSNSNSSAWIIPARAGQTRMPKPTRRTIPDHPRACGANSSLAVLSCKAVGSSQRVRGKRSVRFGRSRVGRIIPARAGQTRRYLFSVPVSSDHPRACGANMIARRPVGVDIGSSPRVRGKPGGACACLALVRIIPARAGQTHAPYQDCRAHPDHPRACGANHGGQSVYTADTGSSPRVRGKLLRGDGRLAVLRIIPARAGQTILYHYSSSLVPDHPRACGANFCGVTAGWPYFGSSPRVRGKQSCTTILPLWFRIIPARAGQTTMSMGFVWASSDHPRACGANLSKNAEANAIAGSSPRVRGKPRHAADHPHERRIIPARAGQTPT